MPLEQQIDTAYQKSLTHNLKFAITARLVLVHVLLFVTAITSVSLGHNPVEFKWIFLIVSVYLCINGLSLKYLDVVSRLNKYTGYIVPLIEVSLLAVSTQFANPENRYLIFFGAENILYTLIIGLTILHANKTQILTTTVVVAAVHLGLTFYNYDGEFITNYGNANVLHIVNPQEFIWFSVYYLLLGYILSRKVAEDIAKADDITHIWIPKIVGGAYKDLLKEDGFLETPAYSVMSITQFPDKYVGADYVKTKMIGEDLVLLVGDVVSHGINVSQGAALCMAAFSAIHTRNPRRVLQAINSVLLEISKEHGGETLALCLRLSKDGEVVYNGILDRIQIVHMDATVDTVETTGKLLGKDEHYVPPPNLSLKLKPGEHLVILTDGAANADATDDQTSIVISYNGNPDNVNNT